MQWPKDQIFYLKKIKDYAKQEGSQTLAASSKGTGDEGTMSGIANLAFSEISDNLFKAPSPLPPVRGPPKQASPLPLDNNVAPMTPVRAPQQDIPSTPNLDARRISSPCGSPGLEVDKPAAAAVMNDPEYVKNVSSLMQAINRAHVEWARKQNELNLCLTRSKNDSKTRDSQLEKMLAQQIEKGDAENLKLRSVEEKFVLGRLITQSEQTDVKDTIVKIGEAAKNGKKLKLI